MVFQRELRLRTQNSGEVHDLTGEVARIVSESGRAHWHRAASLTWAAQGRYGAIEFEPGLEQDLPALLRRLIPPSRNYAHEQTWRDGNGHSHLQATLLGPSLTVPVRDGSPVLGTWQQIFHIECDVRPRERIVVITVLGE